MFSQVSTARAAAKAAATPETVPLRRIAAAIKKDASSPATKHAARLALAGRTR